MRVEQHVAQSNLNRLLKQTQFLLEQHQKSKTQCIDQFNSLLSLIKNEIKKYTLRADTEDVEKLECVLEVVHQQLDKFEEEVNDDIAFLEDQCMYISTILSKSDSREAERMYVELMGDEELMADEEFKKEVLEEAQSSKMSFNAVIDDLRAVIAEGDIDALIAYLESAAEAGQETDDIPDEAENEGECEDDECCDSAGASSERECCKGAYDCKENCVCSSSCGCSKLKQ